MLDNLILIIFWVLVALGATIGIIVGLVKGFARVRTWAVDLCFAALVSFLIIPALKISNPIWNFVAVIAICAASLLLFIAISAIMKKCMDRRYYATDKLFGGFALMIKGVVIVLIIFGLGLFVADLIAMPQVEKFIAPICGTPFWSMIRPYVLDALLLGVLQFSILQGYRSGILQGLWTLIVLGLFVGAGYLSYYLTFNVQALSSAGESLGTTVGFLAQIAAATQGINAMLTAGFWGKCIIVAGLFLGFSVIILILAFVVPRAFDMAREGATWQVIDGVLGAIVYFVMFTAILMAVGALMFQFAEHEMMTELNLFLNGGLSGAFYGGNPLNEIPFIQNLNLMQYFGK